MNKRKRALVNPGILLLFFSFCLNAIAQPVPMSGTRYRGMIDDEEEQKPKKEWKVEFPAFPKDENLLFFYVSPIQTQRFAVDEKSLVVGENEVRYTLVGVSSGGAKNITYEGIKCDGGFYRRYAMGRYDGVWSASRSTDEWKEVRFQGANRPRASLVQDYFCEQRTIAGTPEQMIYRIRHNRSLQGVKYDNRY